MEHHENGMTTEQAAQDSLNEHIEAASALIIIGIDEDGVLRIEPTIKGLAYEPGSNKAHAYLSAVVSDHDNLLHIVNGRINDAARFRALRDFAVLKTTDPERFEVINGMLNKYETSGELKPEAEREAADFDKVANFLAYAIQETVPVLAAPTAVEEKPEPKIFVPTLVKPKFKH